MNVFRCLNTFTSVRALKRRRVYAIVYFSLFPHSWRFLTAFSSYCCYFPYYLISLLLLSPTFDVGELCVMMKLIIERRQHECAHFVRNISRNNNRNHDNNNTDTNMKKSNHGESPAQ